jgi:hypothetical protein
VVHNANIGNFYRNAGVLGGARAVTAEDFQRGAFRNQIAVNRAQLQQASLVRGALPMTPTANNLRFGERTASAATPRGQIGNQRFFSRMTPAGGNGFAAQRTPFTQQQAAIRSAFSGGAGAASGGFRGQTSGSPSGNFGSSGWERFGEPSRTANPGSAAPRTTGGGGWDRFGTPQAQRYSEPQQQRSFAAPNYGASRSLQVSPPIVQPRQAQPRAAAPSGGGYRGGGGAGRTGGGGGGHGRR